MVTYSRKCLLVFAFVWPGLFASDVLACSCMGPKPPCEAYWEASAVFIGTVTDNSPIKTVEDGQEVREWVVRFAAEEVLRGAQGSTTEIVLNLQSTSCTFGFKKGERYLVYAYRNPQDKKLSTSICTRTRTVSEAGEDLQYIRGLASAAAGSLVYGEVQRHTRDANTQLIETPLAQMKVILDGQDKHLEARSDTQGKFAFASLHAGVYKVRIELPAGLAALQTEYEINVADRGCARVYFGVETDGRLRGIAFDASGQPLANAQIAIGSPDKDQNGYGNIVYSDQQGRYEFKSLPPGRYVLCIRFDGLTSQVRPFPIVYYPGVREIGQATVIQVGEGEEVENFDLRLPPLPKEHTIEGTVMWSDGQPAPNAYVGYMMTRHSVSYAIKLDQQGHFSFKVYNGISVTMQASFEIEKGKFVYSDWVEVPATGDRKGIKIVLSKP
jgi:hypothetical protein